jgi:hypothetical protein
MIFLGDPGVGVGVIATGPELVLAGKATTTGDGERNNNAVAHPELFLVDARAELNYFAHKLVAEYVALLQGWNEAVVQV